MARSVIFERKAASVAHEQAVHPRQRGGRVACGGEVLRQRGHWDGEHRYARADQEPESHLSILPDGRADCRKSKALTPTNACAENQMDDMRETPTSRGAFSHFRSICFVSHISVATS